MLMRERHPGSSASLQLQKAVPATNRGNTAAASSSLQESRGLAVWTLLLLVLEASRGCLFRSLKQLQQSRLLPLRSPCLPHSRWRQMAEAALCWPMAIYGGTVPSSSQAADP